MYMISMLKTCTPDFWTLTYKKKQYHLEEIDEDERIPGIGPHKIIS